MHAVGAQSYSAIRYFVQWLALFLLVEVLSLYAATYTENSPFAKLRVSTNEQYLSHSMMRYAEQCSTKVDQLLHCSGIPARNVILCEVSCAKGKQRDLEYRFPARVDMLQLTAGIMRVLLKRRQIELHEKSGNAQILDFLSAGLAYSFMMSKRGNGDFVDYDYGPAIQQFNSNFLPDARNLVLHPVSSELPWLYRLYAMHASILLRCFNQLNINPYAQLLECDAKYSTPAEVFDSAIISQLPENTIFQIWYANQAAKSVRYDWSSDKSDSIEAKVRELESVSVVGTGGVIAELVSVKIDDSKKSIETLRQDRNLLHKRQNDFLRLRNEAPVLLRPALEKYAKALGYLASDDVRAFKRTLKSARKEFAAASARQEHLEEELQQYEKSHTLPIRRFQPELEIIWHFQQLEKELLPIYNSKLN